MMEWLALPLDFILHADRCLEFAIQQYGAWVCLLLFVVGMLARFMPFLRTFVPFVAGVAPCIDPLSPRSM